MLQCVRSKLYQFEKKKNIFCEKCNKIQQKKNRFESKTEKINKMYNKIGIKLPFTMICLN
jgi:hypothetical protein